MNKENPEKIYVVGFPKSGNTWLTRLLADVLDCPAGSGMGKEDKDEIASDVGGDKIKPGRFYRYKILKSHLFPGELIQRTGENYERVVYIRRDYRDVLVSAFFYRYPSVKEDRLRLGGFGRSPLLYFRNRLLLWWHIWKMRKKWGGWGNHIRIWREAADNPDVRISYVSYEELLRAPEKSLRKILLELGLKVPEKSRLQKSIDRQSFANKKKALAKLDQKSDIPLGADFNVRFLRRGEAGDYKKFLSGPMRWMVNKYLAKAHV